MVTVHVLMGALEFMGTFIVASIVIALVMEEWDDRRDARKRRRQSVGLMDELKALELQRERKRRVVHQLRETARQARRPDTSVDVRREDHRDNWH